MANFTRQPSCETEPNAPTTADAFLAWTATLGGEYEGYKLELSHGRVTKMMVNVSRAHSRICTNITSILLTTLDWNIYDVSVADFGVKTKFGVRSPDILVEPANADLRSRASEAPIFIAEVLSPSTTSIDFLEKTPEYTSIDSLRTYLICSQDEPLVWLLARGEDGTWPRAPEMIASLDAQFPLRGLECKLSMADIYRGIPKQG